jgi:hypothetical protein
VPIKKTLGFNYRFDALSSDKDGDSNELSKAFSIVFRADARMSLLTVLRSIFPLLRILVSHQPQTNEDTFSSSQPRTAREKVKREAKRNMARIGQQILRDSRAAIVASSNQNHGLDSAGKGGANGRDLLSLLIRANMSRDLPECQRMSDEDVLAREFSS